MKSIVIRLSGGINLPHLLSIKHRLFFYNLIPYNSYIFLIAIIILFTACQRDQTEPLKVGVAVVNITPPVGYLHYEGKNSTGVLDSLYAKALVFKQGNVEGAILICDLIMIHRDLSRLVREFASKQTGIPFQHISVTATHTHHVPNHHEIAKELYEYTSLKAAEKLIEKDQESYIADLISKMTEAIVISNDQLQEVEIISGIGKAPGISFNRRYLMKNGRVIMNPGNLNPQIVCPAGPNDPDVHFVLFRPIDQETFNASLTVFASHYANTPGAVFSADYPFHLQNNLKEIFGEQFVSIFGTGPCGDINARDQTQPFEDRQIRMGKVAKGLANAIETTFPNEKKQPARLNILSRTIFLPLQDFTKDELHWAKESTEPLYPESEYRSKFRRGKILNLELMRQREAIAPSVSGAPWTLPVEIQVFQLTDETVIVTMPGEIFVELGLDLKKHSPFKNTMIIELANSSISYVPTRKAFTEGDYEPVNSRLAPGSGEKMVEEAILMLNQIKQE